MNDDIDTIESLQLRIAEERDSRGLTQQEAADMVGMSLRAWQNFEGGKSKPQAKHQRAILRVFSGDDPAPQEPEPAVIGPIWPSDIAPFLNMLGGYLMTMDEADRQRFIFEQTRRIFTERRSQK